MKMLSASYLNNKMEAAYFNGTNCESNTKRPSAETEKSFLPMIAMALVTRKITEHIYETTHVKILNNFI